jgi:ribosomal protein S12 methylthiotransferase
MDGRVGEEVRASRRDRVMEHQLAVSEKLNEKTIGKTYEVIIDEIIGNGLYSGRTRYDAPEIDCAVTVSSDNAHMPGDILKVRIKDAFEYDLEGSEVI